MLCLAFREGYRNFIDFGKENGRSMPSIDKLSCTIDDLYRRQSKKCLGRGFIEPMF